MNTFTLQLGKKITKKDLEKAGFKVGNWANDLLNKVTFKKSKVELIIKSVSELGLNGGTLEEIYEAARNQGLELCPAEVGPALRMNYKDQPLGEWLRIAMEPISDSDGCLSIFHVGHDDDGLWLRGRSGDSDDFWLGSGRFVFVRPRKCSKPLELSFDPFDFELKIKGKRYKLVEIK